MIATLLNQRGGAGKGEVALQLAAEWGLRGRCATLIGSEPPRSAPDRSEPRTWEGLPRLFGVAGFLRARLHREAPQWARVGDDILIDDAPRIAGVTRATLLAADIVPIPMQSPWFDGAGLAEMFEVLPGQGIHRPRFAARIVLDRCWARSIIAREASRLMGNRDLSVLGGVLAESDALANAVQHGRPVFDVVAKSPAAGELADFAAKVARIVA